MRRDALCVLALCGFQIAQAADPSDWSIRKTATGPFFRGQQSGTFTLLVSKVGDTLTNERIVVTDGLPPGLLPTAVSGGGWTCAISASLVSCERLDSEPLTGDYPPIVIRVRVANDSPSQINNVAEVQGPGDAFPANNRGFVPVVVGPGVDLRLTKTHAGDFIAGGTGSFQLAVTNGGGFVSAGPITVTDSLPAGLSPVSASGAGWTCALAGPLVTCMRSDPLAAGASFPSILLTAAVSGTAAPQLTNIASVNGGGDTVASNNGATDLVRVVVPPSGQSPAISAITNAASYNTPGQPDYGVAPGSLFAIFGERLGPGPVSATANIGGAAREVRIVGASRNQVTALLPSSTPMGDGTLTLRIDGRMSSPFPLRVRKSSVGLFTRNSGGTGPAILQFVSGSAVELNDLLHPAAPGAIAILWGTGLGAAIGDETSGPVPGDLGLNAEVYVGGRVVPTLYAGRSGCCAGVDQIQFAIPADVQGCYVPVAVRVGQAVSNFGTISVAVPGTRCTDAGGLTAADLDRVERGQPIGRGYISLSRNTVGTGNIDAGTAQFGFYRAEEFLNAAPLLAVPPPGSCISGQSASATAPVGLDAGTLTAAGAFGASNIPRDAQNRYFGSLGNSAFLNPGPASVNNGAGGPGIGPFQQQLTLPQPVVWQLYEQTGDNGQPIVQPLVVDRNRALRVRWTGGNDAAEYAVISGFKNSVSLAENSRGIASEAWFVCTERASAGTFEVPPHVLQRLPGTVVENGALLPVTPGSPNGNPATETAYLSVGMIRQPALGRFQAAGLDSGNFVYVIGGRRADINYK